MNSLRSAVASVIRLVAVGFVLLGVVLLALAYAAGQRGEGDVWRWLIGAAGFIIGMVLLCFSSALARMLTKDYE